MKRPQKTQPEYLSFTRKERIAIIFVVLLMMVYPLIPTLYQLFNEPEPEDHAAFKKEIAGLNMNEPDSNSKRNYDDDYMRYQPSSKNYFDKTVKGELFYFDPNTLPVNGWIKLGVREKTANTIHNYLAKGGRFYKPEDIGKIWGLHEDEVQRLMPYVKIEAKPAVNYNKYPELEKADKPKYINAPVEINNADTSVFIALPGIGSKLAARIIAFRDKLGGFYKVEQVAETYGLPDSVFQKIKSKLVISGSHVKKLNINTASLDELKTHPYLRYNIANAIVQYRAQHGIFLSVTDIKKIMMITDDIYNKAVPYLTIK
ncbi:MAG: helix-hairpin-helix domain-containing protein [Ferruginibacter sp.]|nr:helix-hairpin-helix domain-containing protein [Ferruginibacter sp.]